MPKASMWKSWNEEEATRQDMGIELFGDGDQSPIPTFKVLTMLKQTGIYTRIYRLDSLTSDCLMQHHIWYFQNWLTVTRFSTHTCPTGQKYAT